jgi:xylulokinase
MDLLIGLDVGTTSTKALLFNPQGEILASASQSYALITSEGDRVEQDPQDLWQAALTTLRSLARQIRPADRVHAICQSSQGGTTIPADNAGDPVFNAISWMDQRARSEGGQALERFSEEEFYRTTGWPFHATLPFRHMLWLRKQTPEVFQRARRFLFVNDFIGHRLTGEYCMNPSDASITHLFNIEQGDWDERLLDLASIQRQQLSPLKPSGAVVGVLTKQASLETGLPSGIPLINGAHDQYCAAVGLGVTSPGPMLLSCGTAWVLLAVPETLEIGYQSRMAISCHAVPERWGAMRALGGVGASVEWLIDQIFATADKLIERKQLYAAVNESVLSSQPGAGGLLFYPLSGGHTEIVFAGRGGFIGMNLKHTRADMTRAVLEGVVFDLRWTLEEIQAAGVQVDEMKMVGGAAGSFAWPQIVTDITGIPVVLPPIREAASWGAAVLAGVGAGVFPDAAAALSSTGAVRHIEPNADLRERYDELFGHYKTLCPQVCKAF